LGNILLHHLKEAAKDSSQLVARAIAANVVFVLLVALTLFGSAGRLDIAGFWAYVAVIAAVSGLSLAVVDPDLMGERMRPGGQHVELRFLPIVLLLFAHWALAGLDRGQLHLSDSVPTVLQIAALVAYALASLVIVWAMHVNRFFSSIPRIQSERGHKVISSGPYRFVRHPGYTASLVAAIASGIALGSWLSTLIVPFAVAGLIRRTIVEERLLERELPGYADYASRVRYRLVPGIW
jgi:protein-S-isoprenylcysteine O-methyltransferase Ste14